ncbi:GIY-YIG nuclease family protein [Microbacterium sp. zg.B48]|uniref:GIY-YIG nuclease family protein n=1 Tax=Microbacterium sp. zg.B48 TaxID=2969408 RepID=UPI0035A9203F
MTSPSTPEWNVVLAQPRQPASTIQRGDVPDGPGVYAWFRDGDCVYLGKASNLRSRLGTHLGTSLDLSRSTVRSWVAVRELNLTREHTRRRPTVMTDEQVAIVTEWIRSCDLSWVTSASSEEAASLEAKLLAAWRPPLNVA